MSPFWYAQDVKDPILLMHGEADDNSGTFPIQSERFYMALKGQGATVRYVTLPFEAHGYAGRVTLLHIRGGAFFPYFSNQLIRSARMCKSVCRPPSPVASNGDAPDST